MTASDNTLSERVLILAPHGRDAVLAQRLLTGASLAAVVVPSLPELVQGLIETAGAVLVTEEAVRTADLASLSGWIGEQPAWSDMPFILLTRQGGADRNPTAARLLHILGNVS
ncbi:hybrid sensor histidine kinase/response regulator, partial|uniref:hypothetical protein n=1 Tax=Escherichia coli TaxID=562 RepID=UPI0016AC67DB